MVRRLTRLTEVMYSCFGGKRKRGLKRRDWRLAGGEPKAARECAGGKQGSWGIFAICDLRFAIFVSWNLKRFECLLLRF